MRPPPDRPTDTLAQLREELRQVLRDTSVLHPRPSVDPSRGIDFYNEVELYERALIVAAMAIANGRQRRAAELLHLKPSTLCTKMKSLGIDPNAF